MGTNIDDKIYFDKEKLKGSTNIKKNNVCKYSNLEKSIVCYDIIMKLIYLFKNYFESDKCFYTKNMFENKTNSKRVKIINKTYLTERLFNSNFLCNLFYGKISDDYLKEIIQTMINISYSNRNISNKRVCKRSNYDFYPMLPKN